MSTSSNIKHLQVTLQLRYISSNVHFRWVTLPLGLRVALCFLAEEWYYLWHYIYGA